MVLLANDKRWSQVTSRLPKGDKRKTRPDASAILSRRRRLEAVLLHLVDGLVLLRAQHAQHCFAFLNALNAGNETFLSTRNCSRERNGIRRDGDFCSSIGSTCTRVVCRRPRVARTKHEPGDPCYQNVMSSPRWIIASAAMSLLASCEAPEVRGTAALAPPGGVPRIAAGSTPAHRIALWSRAPLHRGDAGRMRAGRRVHRPSITPRGMPRGRHCAARIWRAFTRLDQPAALALAAPRGMPRSTCRPPEGVTLILITPRPVPTFVAVAA